MRSLGQREESQTGINAPEMIRPEPAGPKHGTRDVERLAGD